jgi:single-stranded-DNA-specific exonuclease
LTTPDVMLAGQLAQKLDNQNRERQRVTRDIQARAETMALAGDPAAHILFAVDPDFNAGVVGLAASRLVESYYRPAVVGHQDKETTRCSCRSIPEFHITEALDQCADLLVRHGGHAAAAGFTVTNENLPVLQQRLQAIALQKLTNMDLRPTLPADLEVALSDMKPEVLDYLQVLQPTGYGNPEAIFASRNLQVKASRTVGADAKHIKMSLSDGHITYDAIGFRLGHWQKNMPPRVDVLYSFESNDFNGRTSLQLNLKDLKPAGQIDDPFPGA